MVKSFARNYSKLKIIAGETIFLPVCFQPTETAKDLLSQTFKLTFTFKLDRIFIPPVQS